MKKADLYKNLNRNTILNDAERVTTSHVMTSDIFVESLWAQDPDQGRPSGVKIVEIKSSGSEKSVNDDKDNTAQWNANEDYKINESAREKHRLRRQNLIAEQYAEEMNKYQDYLFNELVMSGTAPMTNDNVVYNEVNCFKILDNHFMGSESSEEDYDDVEVINCENSDWNDEPYESNLATFAPDPENEKRTVWIYSFKNKRLLSDNDFELVNIPSQDASAISDIDDFRELTTECPQIDRVATPMPQPHVPRLNLVHLTQTPTLPTVTEVTEPKLTPKIEASNTTDGKKNVKPNNWFLSEHATPKDNAKSTIDKTTSIINWMALSPREKRRRFKQVSPINPIPYDSSNLPTLKEVSSTAEKNDEHPNLEAKDCGDSVLTNSEMVKVSHDQATNTIESFSSRSSRRSLFEHLGSAVVDSARKSVKTLRSNVSSAISNLATVKENVASTTEQDNVLVEEIRLKSESFDIPDRDDKSDNEKHVKSDNRPRIKIPVKSAIQLVSEPLENLQSNNWIHEEKLIARDEIQIPTDGRGDRASEALWIKSMALLKPAEWTEYLPIAESIPSLHLSMNTDSIDNEQRQTWCRRLCKLFYCCK